MGGDSARMPAPTREMLVELYVKRRMSIRAVAEAYGVTYRRARRWINEHGITPRPRGYERNTRLAPGVDRAEVRRLRDAGLSPYAIGRRLGVHRSTAVKLLEYLADADSAAGPNFAQPPQTP